MSLVDNGSGNGMVMPVSPMNGSYGAGSWGGDGSFWIIVLFLFALMGNWGNGFGGNAGGSEGSMQRGFDQQSVMNGISGINNSLASAEVSRCNAQANILQTLNANQNANTAAMNSLGMALQNCCCENRAATADVKYAIANEGAQTRNAIQNSVQTVLDKLCQQEIDNLKEQNSNLRTQLNLANLAASQNQQTAQIMADNAAQTQALEHYLNPAPIPAYMVQNPNCCTNNWTSCNCGN